LDISHNPISLFDVHILSVVVTSDKEVQFNVEISTAVFLTKGLGVWIGSVSAILGVGDRVLLGDEQGVGGRVQV